MQCPICNWTPDNPDYKFLSETLYWRVVLAPNQSLLGRCVVHLRRHCGDLAYLRPGEVEEWIEIVRGLEGALQHTFGAKMFNWSCYMNHAYRESSPNPHVHWWAVPRYNRSITISGWTFEDPHFGGPYDHTRWQRLPDHVQGEIARRISMALSQQTPSAIKQAVQVEN